MRQGMRVRAGAIVAAAVLLAGCSSGGSDGGSSATGADGRDGTTTTTARPSTTSGTSTPLADQTPPSSINGLTVEGDTIWVASIKDDVVVQVDRETGAILRRVATPAAGPDDVALAPDGTLYVAGFTSGRVGRIRDGRYDVVTTIPGAALNPIEVLADGRLFLGTYGPNGTLYQVPVDGDGGATAVAQELPDINAMGRGPGDTLLAPAGGIGGPGSVVQIDPATGTITTVVDGLPPLLAGTTDAKGDFYALANLEGTVFAVDVAAKTAKPVHTKVPGAPFDNLAFAEDGTLYLTSFTKPELTEIAPDGTTRTIPLGHP